MNTNLRHPDNTLSADNYDLFIFDLDGTLYDQYKLRNIMLAELIFRWLSFRISLLDLRIIITFRKHREKKLGYKSPDIHQEQYLWCAEAMNLPVERVEQVIEHWMIDYPQNHLRKARYPKVKSFFHELKKQGKHIAIYSDFPVDQKLKSLHLEADRNFYSADEEIAQLKPSKKGIDVICQAFNCPASRTIFFGDRADTDGESARLAGVKFILVDPQAARKGHFYRKLLNQIKA